MPLPSFPAKNADIRQAITDIRQANADIRQANSDISPGAAVTQAVNLIVLNMRESHLALACACLMSAFFAGKAGRGTDLGPGGRKRPPPAAAACSPGLGSMV